jgi:hypothetical protein
MADRPKKQSRLCVFFAQEAIHQKNKEEKEKSVHLFICSSVHLLLNSIFGSCEKELFGSRCKKKRKK